MWPFTDGALYQVYAAVGRVTVVSLQPGEELVTVAAGDTVRWIVGDTSSGSGADLRVNVLVKPIRSGLKTNLVITTSRPQDVPAGAGFDGKGVDGIGVLGVPARPDAGLAAPGAGSAGNNAGRYGLSLENLRFRYAISGNPPWKPLRAFDDGEKVYIQFPPASRRASCRRCLSSARRATGNW